MIHEIKPFREFWLDCYSSALFSILRSFENVPAYSVYYNYYEYYLSKIDLDYNRKFFSLQTNNHMEVLEAALFKNVTHYNFVKEPDIAKSIKEKLQQNFLILLGVDIYYWIPDNYNWHRNHFDHFSFIKSYNEKEDLFYVFETGSKGYKEYKLDSQVLCKAVRNSRKQDSILIQLNDKINIDLISPEIVKRNAYTILNSIYKILDNQEMLFNFENTSKNEKKFIADHIQTHFYSLECRQVSNKLLFKKVLYNSKMSAQFKSLARNYMILKNKSIKNSLKGSFENYELFADELLSQLMLEASIWENYLDGHV